ncbi:MAG: 50S ribosomal protein L11 methyltransferase [Proteobacteria bacterium]|nr:50S ribosomal protein L11 methyltransferase [Pseudomonadota bacterium]
MSWLQLTLESDFESAEQLSELLEQFAAVSVSLSPVSNEKIFGQAIEKDSLLWQQTRIVALLHEDTDLDTLLVCLRNRVGADRIGRHEISILEDRDWVGEYRLGHGVKIFADRLCVCPSWCEIPKDDIATIILDPGLAFGTGTHETTAACLEWLAQSDLKEKSVIDYGCGSGILALAAVKLGAGKVYAVDIDPQALQASEENAKRNEITDQLVIAHPDDIQLPVVDVLLANVLLNPLQGLARHFADLVKPSGDLVLSGLLSTQAEECLEAYQSWFNMDQPVFKQEWSFLHGTRR